MTAGHAGETRTTDIGSRLSSEIAETVLRSHGGGEVTIGDEHPFVIIGERINPTGRKKLAEEIKTGDYDTVRQRRDRAGGGRRTGARSERRRSPGSTRPRCSARWCRIVHEVVDVPICIDSSTPEALEAAVPLAGARC